MPALAGDRIKRAGEWAGRQIEVQVLRQGRGRQGCQGNGGGKGVGPCVEHNILLFVWKCQEIGGMRNENQTQTRSIIKKIAFYFEPISVSQGL
ncbi:hypothetical protein D3C87_1853360 [compost metagenome]